MNTSGQILAMVRRALALATMLVLAGCGGGGAGTTSSVSGGIEGIAIKGPVGNATVTVYAIIDGTPGAQVASGTTDSQGAFDLSVGGYAGSVMLQLTGGTYVDEATGIAMPMAAGDVMTAALPTISAGARIGNVQLTPLTSMAQVLAQHMAGGMTDINIQTANAAVGAYFAAGDILRTPSMNPLAPGAGSAPTQAAINYGMALAAMSRYAHDQGMSSSSAIVTAMMNDAADGTMNGMTGGRAVMMGGLRPGTIMPSTAGTRGLGAAMADFVASAQNRSGVSASSMQTLVNRLNGSDGQILTASAPTPIAGATVTGVVFNGPVSHAMVSAFAISNGTPGARISGTVTDDHGNFAMSIGSYSGPLMLQATGGAYTDESTGMTVTMTAGDVMSAVLPAMASGTGITVTPVTSMAQARAAAMNGGMTDANVAAANAAMGRYFDVSDILHTLPLDPSVPGAGISAGQDARNYGMVLASISEYARSLGMPGSSAMVTAMMKDASDGVMNGMMASSQIALATGGGMGGMGHMTSTAGASGLATAMTAFMGSAANASGLHAADMTALLLKLTNSNGQI